MPSDKSPSTLDFITRIAVPFNKLSSGDMASGEPTSARNELEKDFEDFFNFCKKQNFTSSELEHICKPLRSAWRWRFWTRVGVVLFVLVGCWWLCSYVEVVSWPSSAIGRLVLIELLPLWDWTLLYNAKCLVDGSVPKKPELASLGKYETDKVNCVLCEQFVAVPSLSNVSYSMLEQNFLEKGLPVIINDSHSRESLNEFLDIVLSDHGDFLDSDPCNVETNLVLKKFFTIGTALQKISESPVDDEWFLQLRNCQFKAVKASRKFIRRPYYYPLHFEPFYSSWLLLSNNYKGMEKEIYVHGLVFIQQLSGSVIIHLIPKSPCDKVCLEVQVTLKAEEGFVFSTDLWILNYQSTGELESITTIMEIDWRY